MSWISPLPLPRRDQSASCSVPVTGTTDHVALGIAPSATGQHLCSNRLAQEPRRANPPRRAPTRLPIAVGYSALATVIPTVKSVPRQMGLRPRKYGARGS